MQPCHPYSGFPKIRNINWKRKTISICFFSNNSCKTFLEWFHQFLSNPRRRFSTGVNLVDYFGQNIFIVLSFFFVDNASEMWELRYARNWRQFGNPRTDHSFSVNWQIKFSWPSVTACDSRSMEASSNLPVKCLSLVQVQNYSKGHTERHVASNSTYRIKSNIPQIKHTASNSTYRKWNSHQIQHTANNTFSSQSKCQWVVFNWVDKELGISAKQVKDP